MTDDSVVHVTPEPDDPPHDLNGFCWCQPVVEYVPPEGRIYIHRRGLDSPHIEEDDGNILIAGVLYDAETLEEAENP